MTDPESESLLLMLLRRARARPVLALLPLAVCAIFGVVIGMVRSAGYVAQSSLKANAGALPLGNLSGLASQLGVNLIANNESEPIGYYARVLKSRDLLRALASTEYRVNLENDPTKPARSRSGNLAGFLGIDSAPGERALLRTVRRLDRMITVRVDIPSGIITVRTAAPSRDLAAQLNRRTLDLLNTFNIERRHTRARAQREFIEAQSREARASLDSVEDRFEGFLEQNRDYGSSPRLRFEADRLQRAVTLRQQIYTTALQALEQARVDEVRNTPVITIIDDPENWVLPSGGFALMSGIGLLLGVILAVCALVGAPHLDRLGGELRAATRILARAPARRSQEWTDGEAAAHIGHESEV